MPERIRTARAMRALTNLEFFNAPDGTVMVCDANGVNPLREEERELISLVYAYIDENFSAAFKALQDKYRACRPNIRHYQFKIVWCFLRCNCGKLDHKLDFDRAGQAHLEDVDCPMAGECKWYNIICHPERSTNMTTRQREVMKLFVEGQDADAIGDMLSISPETVKTIKRDALRKTGCHSLAEFIARYQNILE